ncbi:hypothetical protein [Pollutibacter soli]|uniref:hypothetical protein n=1 Tax=Pollutibacter soli TaxID=3034157 RepID=UPI0030132877
MTDFTKIRLSAEELRLVTDADFILTKNGIIEKVYGMYGGLSEWMQNAVIPFQQELNEVLDISPKISRGENYLGLPFVILDYPRYFRTHDIFAIRTMFWWGKFMSVTLHLKGNYREHYHQRIIEEFHTISQLGFYAGVGPDEWEHHFGEDNYLPAAVIEPDEWLELYQARDFTKLAIKFPLDQWEELPLRITTVYSTILKILGGN